MKDNLIDSLIHGKFNSDDIPFKATQNTANNPIILEGVGKVWENNNSDIRFRGTIDSKSEKILENLFPEFQKLLYKSFVDKESAFNLELFDFHSSSWKSINCHLSIKRASNKIAISTTIKNIESEVETSKTINECEIVSKDFLPIVTNTRTTIDNLEIPTLVVYFRKGDIQGFTGTLNILSYPDRTVFKITDTIDLNEEIKENIIKSVEIINGKKLNIIYESISINGITKVRIHSTKHDYIKCRSVIPNEKLSHAKCSIEFIKSYVSHFQSDRDEVIYPFWLKVVSCSVFAESKVLAASIAIEGIIREGFGEYLVKSKEEISEIKNRITEIEESSLSKETKCYLKDTVRNNNYRSPRRALIDILSSGDELVVDKRSIALSKLSKNDYIKILQSGKFHEVTLPEESAKLEKIKLAKLLSKSWNNARNKTAHGSDINMNDEKFIEFCRDMERCYLILYLLIFKVIKYRGEYYDLSIDSSNKPTRYIKYN
ncbi:hypothetical protein [Bacterioplanoides sp.]|uniref:hypothetical protein n=1 Tax=Bacterioplanoides sp. TaxID=2066072 RepID=UPI003B5A284B